MFRLDERVTAHHQRSVQFTAMSDLSLSLFLNFDRFSTVDADIVDIWQTVLERRVFLVLARDD